MFSQCNMSLLQVLLAELQSFVKSCHMKVYDKKQDSHQFEGSVQSSEMQKCPLITRISVLQQCLQFQVQICRSGALLLLEVLAIDALQSVDGGLWLCVDPELESPSESGVEGRL